MVNAHPSTGRCLKPGYKKGQVVNLPFWGMIL
jgi:hypothetical protein